MTLFNRLTSKTPTFFSRVGIIGASIAAVGAALLAPMPFGIVLPVYLTQIAGYLLTAGTVATIVSKAVLPAHADPVTPDPNDLKVTQIKKQNEDYGTDAK